MLLPGLCAVPIGVWALSYVSVDILSGLIAFMLILYGGYFASRKNLPLIKGRIHGDSTLGRLAALGGLRRCQLHSMVCDERYDKARYRISCNIIILLCLLVPSFWRSEALIKDTILLSAIAMFATYQLILG